MGWDESAREALGIWNYGTKAELPKTLMKSEELSLNKYTNIKKS